jgi:hypothetical protein
MGLVLKLRKKIVDVLVRGAEGVVSEDLENKARWLESDEKRQVFFLESSEKSAVGVDGRRGISAVFQVKIVVGLSALASTVGRKERPRVRRMVMRKKVVGHGKFPVDGDGT